MPSSTPLFSILILTYNNLQYLEGALESVYNQDYPNIEVIVSDDASKSFPDAVYKTMVDKRPSTIKSMKLIRHPVNLGMVRNLNNAIKESSGDYFMPLAVDDLLYDGSVLSKIVTYFKANDEISIASGYVEVFSEDMTKSIQVNPKPEDIEYLRAGGDKLFQRLCNKCFISGAACPSRRSLLDKVGYYDERYRNAEDYPRFLSLSRMGIPIGFIDTKLIKYRLGGISTTSRPGPAICQDLVVMFGQDVLPYLHRFDRNKVYAYQRFFYYISHLNLNEKKIFGYFINITLWYSFRLLNRLIWTLRPRIK